MKRDPLLKPLFKAAKEQGWKVEYTDGGHLKWIPPEGEFAITPSTPSDGRRGFLNARSTLRKAGLKI